jgi:hypothetical protein
MRGHHSIMAAPILSLCGGMNDVIRGSDAALHQSSSSQVSAGVHAFRCRAGMCAAPLAYPPPPALLQGLPPNRGSSLPTLASQMTPWNPMLIEHNGMWRNELLLQHGLHGLDAVSLFGRPNAAVNAHRYATDSMYFQPVRLPHGYRWRLPHLPKARKYLQMRVCCL